MKFISCVAVCIYLLLVDVAVAQNCDQFYTTKSGDTLSSIADQFYADKQKWRLIKEANTATRSINDNNMPIDFRLFIPCLNSDDDATIRDIKNQTAENVGNESLLESLLGDGIVKKPTPTVEQKQAEESQTNDVETEVSPAKRITIKKTATISTESNALLEDLLGEDIISKKSVDEEQTLEGEQTLEDIELTNALREILLQPPSEESTDSVFDKEIVNDLPVVSDSDDNSTINEDLNAEKDTETVADQELAADTKQEQEQDASKAEADSNGDEQAISAQSDNSSDAKPETVEAESDSNSDEQAISAQSDDPGNTELQTAEAEDVANDDEQAISDQSDEPGKTELQTVDVEGDTSSDAQAASSLPDDDSNSDQESPGVDDEVEMVSLTDSNIVENDESELTQTTDQTDIDDSNQDADENIELAKINAEPDEMVSELMPETTATESMDTDNIESSDKQLSDILHGIESDQQKNQQPVVTAIEIEQLKNDLSEIQLQAKLEIEAMKSRMEELEQELVEAQRTDANANLSNQQKQSATTQMEQDLGLNDEQQISDDIVEQDSQEQLSLEQEQVEQALIEQGQEQQSDVQIASIEMPDVDDLGESPSGNKLSANQSLMSVLRLRLIETVTSLKSELSATDDSDTEKADLIRAEIEKLESTFEEIESIAAEELEREKSKVEQLEARLNSVNKTDSSDDLLIKESKTEEANLDSCRKFPNLCKYFEPK